MTGNWYGAYGLRIHSELELPAPNTDAGNVDVRIQFGKIAPCEPLPGSRMLLKATPEEIICEWPDAGRAMVRGGDLIVLDALPNADHALLAQWVQGACISMILHQRGMLVLHASAVEIEGTAVAFAGQVGWGKSTTAASLHAKGHRLLADDVVAVKVNPGSDSIVLPGFPHMKLMPEALTFLGENANEFGLAAGDDVKRFRPSTERFAQDPVPLKFVFILGEGPACVIEPMPPQAALMELLQHLFIGRKADFLRRTNMAGTHLANLSGLINSSSVCRLRRPKSFDKLPIMLEMIEQRVTQRNVPTS